MRIRTHTGIVPRQYFAFLCEASEEGWDVDWSPDMWLHDDDSRVTCAKCLTILVASRLTA